MGTEESLSDLRIAVIYDCLFPYTVGGGERWYRLLAEGLRDAGGVVTYVTRRQWQEPPHISGIQVVAVSGASELYDEKGGRRLWPTLCFGVGVGRWLAQHRKDFDVVQVANFPFWSLLAARLALIGCSTRVVVDWFEIWSPRFWREYAGNLMGAMGYVVQRVCIAASPTTVVLSASNAARLRAQGHRARPVVLLGLLPPPSLCGDGQPEAADPPFVLFAGRHIRDKGVDLLPEVFELVLQRLPWIRFVIAGDGPLRSTVESEVSARGIAESVNVRGFVSDDELHRLLAGATCVIVPSRREGYGFMGVDAMGRGTPVVTPAFDENRAVDQIEPGRNGVIAAPPTPERLAEGIVEVVLSGVAMRKTTTEWYQEHAHTKTTSRSVDQMVTAHREWAATAAAAAAPSTARSHRNVGSRAHLLWSVHGEDHGAAGND